MPLYPKSDTVGVTAATTLASIGALTQTITSPPTKAEADLIQTKVNEILAALKTNLK